VNPDVTFLCPTRGHPKEFQQSMESLLELAHSENYEVLTYLDDDDPSDYPSLWHVTYIKGPRFGYPRLHEAIAKFLIPNALGRWLFVWNDNATMRTRWWDQILEEREDNAILNPDSNRSHQTGINTFPIIPREWVKLVGWAKNGANDTWFQVIGQMLGKHINVPITVEHTPTDSRTQGYDPATFFCMNNYARMGFAAGRIHEHFYAKSAHSS